jgi:hypothetical protein
MLDAINLLMRSDERRSARWHAQREANRDSPEHDAHAVVH